MINFKPWVLEWGKKSLSQMGFQVGAPQPMSHDGSVPAEGLAGLVEAQSLEGSRGDVGVRLVQWRYGSAEQAIAAAAALQKPVLAGCATWGFIGPSVVGIFLTPSHSASNEALAGEIMRQLVQYEPVPQGTDAGADAGTDAGQKP